MEIVSVKARGNFISNEPCWEHLIKDRQRTTAPLSSIEDPILRNKVITQKRTGAKRCKKWREAHPEKAKESRKRYLEKPENRAKVRAREKEWREANPDKVKIYQERNKKNVKAWAEAHPERVKELNRKSDKKRAKSPKRIAWVKDYLKKPEVMAKHSEYERKRNQTKERKAQNKASKKRQMIRKKGAALFAILCNLPPIKEA